MSKTSLAEQARKAFIKKELVGYKSIKSKQYDKLEVSFYKKGKHTVYYGESKNILALKAAIAKLGVSCE